MPRLVKALAKKSPHPQSPGAWPLRWPTESEVACD